MNNSTYRDSLSAFLQESLLIEGIVRAPKKTELAASENFLGLQYLSLESICAIQAVYAPGFPLRDRQGMNVRVGNHVAPFGGPAIIKDLTELLRRIDAGGDPWRMHLEFEHLHPFMDGNGRTGRIVWAWNMLRVGQQPFALPFLHRWYYQTLDVGDGVLFTPPAGRDDG